MNSLQLYQEAQKAGEFAYNNAIPIPMVVETHQDMLNDNSPIVESELIEDGVCGFAWVTLRLKNSITRQFINDMKRVGIASSDINDNRDSIRFSPQYEGGYQYWVKGSQSYQRKMAYARAFAGVLYDVGILAFADGRLD